MIKMLNNLTKAAIAAAITPVAIIADAAMFIPTSLDNKSKHPFQLTEKVLKSSGKNIAKAINN